MFRNIAAVGNDVLVRGSKQVGSLLIEQMKVAGDLMPRLQGATDQPVRTGRSATSAIAGPGRSFSAGKSSFQAGRLSL
jgi:hypothetical protein